jgi:hypothetical protein
MSPTLVLLAAGVGSRYGGPKQIDAVGPGGATLIDYAAYDARRVGFDRVVLVVRSENQAEVRAAAGDRIARHLPVDYAVQDTALPPGFRPPPGRTKPWGTGHALLAAAPHLHGPFAVLNADDFYGARSYRILADWFRRDGSPAEHALVSFELRTTLSPAGPVNRGLCQVDGDSVLREIREVLKIEADGEEARHPTHDGSLQVPGDTAAYRIRGGRGPRATRGWAVGRAHSSGGPGPPRRAPRGAHRTGRVPEGPLDVSVSSSSAAAIADHFAVEGRLVSLAPQPGGHINESWLAVWEGPEGRRRFLLQHVNRHVFRQPEKVMENMVRLTRHVADHLARESVPEPERRMLRVVPTRDGASHHRDPDGEVWRLLVWIEGTRSTERAETSAEARAAARAFGRFLRQLEDLPGPPLHETIPAFHDTPGRLEALERAVVADRVGRVEDVRAEIEAVLDRRPLGHSLAESVARGELKLRTSHNDAKISNVLFDEGSGEPLCVVDLDTVMPGLALHDFGDLVRSGGSDSAEDEQDLGRVAIRVPVFEALARGFAEGAMDALSPRERSLFPTAAGVITLEQAARFLTDHLDGDRYYRIDRPNHNLDRTRTQIRLVESLEAHDGELQGIVKSL